MGEIMAEAESRGTISIWFFVCGLASATWFAQIPRVTVELDADFGPLSLALLCNSLGSVVGMTLAPSALSAVGPSRVAWVAGLAMVLILPLPLQAPSLWVLGLVLLLFGISGGFMDVTMNAAAAACETAAGRPIMSSFHGWFSVGMVAGAAGGSAAISHEVSPPVIAASVIALAVVLLLFSRPHTFSRPAEADGEVQEQGAWRDRTAWSLAAMAFLCMFLEGAMVDWLGNLEAAFATARDKSARVTPIAFACFTATWAGGRFLGDRLTALISERGILIGAGLLTAVGIGVGLFLHTPLGLTMGTAITGLGLANAIPVLFRAAAAADASGRGTGLVLVTGIGYAGFLTGPPMIGFTAQAVGLPKAMFLVIAGGLILAAAVTAMPLRRPSTLPG